MPKDGNLSNNNTPNEIPQNVIKFIHKCSSITGKCEEENFNIFLWSSCKYDVNGIRLESPIEQILFSAFHTLHHINGFPPISENNKFDGIEIYPQYHIDKYRVDFLVINDHPKYNKKIVVECDSQQFHERSEMERRYEKARDRHLLNNGYKIFHFTGTEIIKEPFRVAAEILSAISDRPIDQIDQGQDYL